MIESKDPTKNRNKKEPAMRINCDGCQNSCCSNPHLTPVLLPSEEIKFKRQSVRIKTPFKQMFVLKKESNKCIFLDVNTMCCKIYRKRPLECQLYPFLLDFTKGINIKLDDRFCPHMDLLVYKKRDIVDFVKKHNFPEDWINGYKTMIDF